jgi:hypothetical protein
MPPSTYSAFNTATLLLQESVAVAALHETLGDWAAVRVEAVASNVVQARTRSSCVRLTGEICSRLTQLGREELRLLVHGTRHDQAALLWLALCRRYAFIRDFAIEVLRERHLGGRRRVGPEDFEAFFNRKADWHPELEAMSANTRKRLRGTLFQMMRQAGLLQADDALAVVLLGPRLMAAIATVDRDDLALFPTFETRGAG